MLLCGAARTQEPPQEPPPGPVILQNTGKPITVPLHCTDEDVQWAGLSCTLADPCPAYLEISAVEGVGDRIFAAGDIHSVALTLFSLLLASEDGGRTWREAHERMRGAGLDHIQFADAGHVWISGEELFPLTRNPFFLVTADGGESWRTQPLSDEPRGGFIQQFQFDGAKNGSLVVDRGPGAGKGRYELYESRDGGANWSLKEGNATPPALKSQPQPSAWRARADGATHSFQIERQAGGRWTPVAAFAVQLGSCKPGDETDPR
ncbi:MAG: hypothetical protein ABSC23_19120 [Bryobacteraceae bacterium]